MEVSEQGRSLGEVKGHRLVRSVSWVTGKGARRGKGQGGE